MMVLMVGDVTAGVDVRSHIRRVSVRKGCAVKEPAIFQALWKIITGMNKIIYIVIPH
jgi:hypothetical protein